VLAKPLIAACACFALASCGLPRSAGFTSEVLAASNASTAGEDGERIYDFAVYEVNRATLPVLTAWPAAAQESFSWIPAHDQPASLMIAEGDQLQLTIWDAEENSIFGAGGLTALQPTQVDSTGRIFVPFIGELRVSGMSATTARARIEEELVRTVPSAQVQLVVEAGRANTVNLASGVGGAGLYPLPGRNFTILELFSQAGGPDPSLVSPQVRLIRNGTTFGIPYARLLEEPQLNTTVRGGDRIYVVAEEREFIALGATGSQSIVPFPQEDLTALEAMALIGGVNAGSGNPESVLIMRAYDPLVVRDGFAGPPKDRVVFTIDLTSADGLFSADQFLMADGDLIYGTESALGPALTVFGLGNSLVSTFGQ
jgi:polysaccharide export outer membrane protein